MDSGTLKTEHWTPNSRTLHYTLGQSNKLVISVGGCCVAAEKTRARAHSLSSQLFYFPAIRFFLIVASTILNTKIIILMHPLPRAHTHTIRHCFGARTRTHTDIVST